MFNLRLHVPPPPPKKIKINKSKTGYITPGYDEIQRVSVCPGGLATGYTYFLPQARGGGWVCWRPHCTLGALGRCNGLAQSARPLRPRPRSSPCRRRCWRARL